MPELPEVETMVRGIREQVEGSTIVAFRQPPCERKPISFSPSFAEIQQRITGQKILKVRRIAKRIVFEHASGDSLVIEPRMTGLLVLSDPPSVEHLRMEWELKQGAKRRLLWFWDRRGLGTASLYTAEERSRTLGPEKLGTDALLMTPEEWRAICAKTSQEIKVLLLNQKKVAGIGNLYASEILHLAGISPFQPANELSPQQIERLAEATLQVLLTAIDSEGSTLGDGTYRNALSEPGRYQNAHRVYAREGEICPGCEREPIQRAVQAQRSTFYCPKCQKLRKSSRTRKPK